MNDSEVKVQTELKPQDVAEFLRKNPDFFVGKDELLLDLVLPHQRGAAISLVERQVALLRKQNQDYRQRLNCLAETARNNEQLFSQIRQLVLALLESKDLEQLTETITDSLNHEFKIKFHSLILFSDKPLKMPVRVEHIDIAAAELGKILAKGKTVCGQFSDSHLNFLFPGNEGIGSTAIIPLTYSLNNPAQLGVLALGSEDPGQFQEGIETLFIGYLGDVLSRCLAQHL